MALTLVGKPTTSQAICNYTAGDFSKPTGVESNGTWTEVSGSLSPSSPAVTVIRQTRKMQRDKIELGNFTYSWDFGSTTASGQHTFGGLTAGESKILSATVTVKVEKITTRYTKTQERTRTAGSPASGETPAVSPGAWSGWSDVGSETAGTPSKVLINAVPGTRTYTLTVFAKPATFAWGTGVAADQIIESSNGLSATKWNELVDRTNERKKWIDQKDTGVNYNNAKVSEGDWITETKYNILTGALGKPSVTGGTDGTLIKAGLFTSLADAVNAS